MTSQKSETQLKRALIESENRFRRIIEATPDAMHFYRLDKNNRLIFKGGNPAAGMITGVSYKTLIGKPIEEAFPEFNSN